MPANIPSREDDKCDLAALTGGFYSMVTDDVQSRRSGSPGKATACIQARYSPHGGEQLGLFNAGAAADIERTII